MDDFLRCKYCVLARDVLLISCLGESWVAMILENREYSFQQGVLEYFHNDRGHCDSSIAVTDQGIFAFAFVNRFNYTCQEARWNLLKMSNVVEDLFQPEGKEWPAILTLGAHARSESCPVCVCLCVCP